VLYYVLSGRYGVTTCVRFWGTFWDFFFCFSDAILFYSPLISGQILKYLQCFIKAGNKYE
jgi:hypothetical protein